MTHCPNCDKQIPCEGNSSSCVPGEVPGLGYKSMVDDREMSRFLYRLTQEIVTSRDFSDSNISRICDKYFRSAVYPDKKRFARTIVDLKRKLLMDVKDSELEPLESIEDPVDVKDKLKRQHFKVVGKHSSMDKSTSAQSFGKLPGMLVNSFTQFPAEPVKSSKRSSGKSSETLQRCLTEAENVSKDSISTITTYNFSSPLYSPLLASSRRESRRSEDEQTLIGQLLACSRGGDRSVEDDSEPMDGGGGGGRNKRSVDSSADMVMRMAASDRVFQGEKKCPLRRCQHFASSPPCGAGSGGCRGGCASDFPLPKLPEAEESSQTTCCGKKKKKKSNGSKKKDGGKKGHKQREGNRAGRK